MFPSNLPPRSELTVSDGCWSFRRATPGGTSSSAVSPAPSSAPALPEPGLTQWVKLCPGHLPGWPGPVSSPLLVWWAPGCHQNLLLSPKWSWWGSSDQKPWAPADTGAEQTVPALPTAGSLCSTLRNRLVGRAAAPAAPAHNSNHHHDFPSRSRTTHSSTDQAVKQQYWASCVTILENSTVWTWKLKIMLKLKTLFWGNSRGNHLLDKMYSVFNSLLISTACRLAREESMSPRGRSECHGKNITLTKHITFFTPETSN